MRALLRYFRLYRIFRRRRPAIASKIAKILGLDKKQARAIDSTAAPLRSVSEFLTLGLEAGKSLPLGKALKEALGESVAPAKFLIKLFEKLTEETDPEQLGFIACTLAYQQSAVEALEAVGKPKKRIPFALGKKEVSAQLGKADLSDAKSLRGFSLQNPLPHAFVQRANRGLYGLVRSAGYSEAEWRNILAELRKRFAPSLKTILEERDHAKRFDPFKKWLKEGTEEHLAYSVLDLHAERQRRLYEEEPVFRKEPFALSHVYVETDCCKLLWEQIKPLSERAVPSEKKRGLDPFSEKSADRQPLLDTVMELLKDKDFHDAIVIQGVAGSGKSAFTRRLCVALLEEGLRPIRVRIRDLLLDLALKEDLQQAILNDREADPEKEEGVPAPRDLFLDGAVLGEPVQFGKARISPYVIILYGWDEVVSTKEGFTKQRPAAVRSARL